MSAQMDMSGVAHPALDISQQAKHRTAIRSKVRFNQRVVIIGGGPGGYEAATIAARLGAQVTLIEAHGVGGNAVLTDVMPSKTIIATAEYLTVTERAHNLGIMERGQTQPHVDLAWINNRVKRLAKNQSMDIATALDAANVRIIKGRGRIDPEMGPLGTRSVIAQTDEGNERIECDIVLVATGASPRELPDARPDGVRILTWKQLYDLQELPEHLIVVGSGVTGAEFAGAYCVLGSKVTLVSSRSRVLPGQDEDAATVVEHNFRKRGMNVLSNSRAEAVRSTGSGVEVTLSSGEVITGSHCLMAVGAIPNTKNIGLLDAGVRLTDSGHIKVDRMSRTTAIGVYAAGDCTDALPLASVAAQQGRIAMWHALGDAVKPLDLSKIAAAIFTIPEVATVGISEAKAAESGIDVVVSSLPIMRNPRAKMLSLKQGGFVKMIAERETGVVLGGVIVCPRASDLIFPITLAVTHRMTVEQVAEAFTVYPSLSGTVAEVARSLH